MLLDPWGREVHTIKDKMLIDICKMCDRYVGDEHDYAECEGCPVLRLYMNYNRLSVDKSFSNPNDFMGRC